MSAEELWKAYCEKENIDIDTPYRAWGFGDAPDQLAEDEDFIFRVQTYIYSNLSDPDLNRSSIAEYLHMSQDYLSYVFHQKFNQTLSAYITSMRIDKAKELLERTNWGMDIIAEKTGFSSSSYFHKQFFQSASPSDLHSCSPLKSSESNTNSSLLVRRLNVKSSILVSSAPIISGERNIHHSVIMVFYSSLVNRQSLSPVSKPLPTLPSGSISQSGKQPSFT